jgi:putative iron-regulated protein
LKTPLVTIIKSCLLTCLAIILLVGCDLLDSSPKKVAPAKETIKLNIDNLLSSANLFAYTQMAEALTNAQALDSIIASFLHHPNPLSLEESQKAWTNTYQSYLKVSFFSDVPRFENPKYNEQNDTYKIIKEELDSWPIEPGYIDYLPLYPLSGIVNDLTLKITEQGILQQHGFSDSRYASIGFHPMEFLLFGNNSNRSAKDFVPQDNSVETVELDVKSSDRDSELDSVIPEFEDNIDSANQQLEAPLIHGPQNHNRRREYIRLLSALNVQRLQKLTDRWEPAHGYYAKQWRQPQSIQNVQRVYQAAIDTLQTEVLDQHINVMINSAELEDLRSPFAKQDVRDMQAILSGIETLFSAENGFISEIKLRNATVADKITAQFKRLLSDAKKLPSALTLAPIKSRQKQLAPIHKSTIKLLELLYSGAAVIGIPLRELPVSTS